MKLVFNCKPRAFPAKIWLDTVFVLPALNIQAPALHQDPCHIRQKSELWPVAYFFHLLILFKGFLFRLSLFCLVNGCFVVIYRVSDNKTHRGRCFHSLPLPHEHCTSTSNKQCSTTARTPKTALPRHSHPRPHTKPQSRTRSKQS